MKLAIISHTEHYTTEDGTVVGWSPTVNEINHLLELFDTIYHLAMYYDGDAPKSTMAYVSNRIQFIALPSVGGKGIKDKLGVLMQAPKVIRMVSKTLKEVDYFQLRTPTGIGVFLIPYLTLFTKTKGWYKYAGNWNQKHPPLGYRLQRFMLKQQSRQVTINGSWPDQPLHCLSFENPCLTDEDVVHGKEIVGKKTVLGEFNLCFVGRLEAEKGVYMMVKALLQLPHVDKEKLGTVHFVGDGKAKKDLMQDVSRSNIDFKFHGLLTRAEVHSIYENSHGLVLPSDSEGFPKVIAEAMNYGCIPIVSDVSSIGQYIKHGDNGFLVSPLNSTSLQIQLSKFLNITSTSYKKLLDGRQRMLKCFTFSYYNSRIKNEILD